MFIAVLAFFGVTLLLTNAAQAFFNVLQGDRGNLGLDRASLVVALLLTVWTLSFTHGKKSEQVAITNLSPAQVTVFLTALDDAAAVEPAVRDFLAHPRVAEVVVVDNDSADGTRDVAAAAGAKIVVESNRGYGRVIHRAILESQKATTELICIAEGDGTFRAKDIGKFLEYIAHADIVIGTRTTETLRAPGNQLTSFIFWGNLFAAKILEIKHIGRGTFTDLGTTYKVFWRRALGNEFIESLDPAVNLAFNAHFLDLALQSNLCIVEIPIQFHPRIGKSKGGNVSNLRAIRVGVEMLVGILISWRIVRKIQR